MASRQNLNNRTDAFKGAGKRGILGKVYGALGKQFKQRNQGQATAKAQRQVEKQRDILAGDERPIQSRDSGGFRGQGAFIGERDPTRGGPRIAPDFRDHMRQAEDRRQRMTPPPAPTQPPIQTGPGYEQRDEPVFDHSALETPEQVPGQSTPLPEPSTASNVSNRLARNRVTANQPTEEIGPDSPRSRGMRRRR